MPLNFKNSGQKFFSRFCDTCIFIHFFPATVVGYEIEITLRRAYHLKTKHETVLKQYMTASENIKFIWLLKVFQFKAVAYCITTAPDNPTTRGRG